MLAPTVRTEAIPDGDPGTRRTLAAMDRMMDAGASDPAVIDLAQSLALSVPSRDEDGQMRVFLGWVRRNLHYVHDPRTRAGVELVKDLPSRLLREIQARGKAVEDCDGHVVMLGALARAVGIEAEPVVISPDSGPYAHVMLRYRSPATGWVTVDPITDQGPGWFPMGAVRVGTFANGRIDPRSPMTVQGLGDLPPAAVPPGWTLDAWLAQTAPRVEAATTLMWFVLGAAAIWSWVRTGKAPL